MELIAVMLIMAILAGTAVPALSSIGQTRQAVAARTLLHGVTTARQHAVATGQRSWVVLDANAETWSVLVEDVSNPGRAGAVPMLDAASGHAYSETLNSGAFSDVQIVSVNFDGGAEIGFDWQGRPLNDAENDLAADGEIVLTGNHRITVIVETGHVRHIAP